MPGQSASEIRTAPNGNIYVAPIATTAPTNATGSLAAGWIDLGYASEDGVTFTDGKELRDQRAWQAFYPVGKKITQRNASLAFDLMQWNKDTIKLAFGGGTWTALGGGQYRYAPPAPETVDYRAMVVDWIEGAVRYRIYIARCLVEGEVETKLARTDDALLPIKVGVVGVSGSDPWTLFTDDVAAA